MSWLQKLLRSGLAVILIISSLIVFSEVKVSAGSVGPSWTKFPGELSLGSEQNVLDTSVIKDGGTYKMWYTHIKTETDVVSLVANASAVLNSANIIDDLANLDALQLVNDLHNVDLNTFINIVNSTSTVVGYAESTNGTYWTVQNSTAFLGESSIWNSTITSKVIKDDGIYKMYYTHLKTTYSQAELNTILNNLGSSGTRYNALTQLLGNMTTVVGYATSINGINWTIQNSEVLGGSNGFWDGVSASSVIKDGILYKMYYTRVNSTIVPADLQIIDDPSFNIDSVLNLVDKISTVIGYADSPDGIVWTPRLVNGNPATVGTSQLLSGGGGMFTGVSNANVITNGTSANYEMWYTRGVTDLTNSTLRQLANETALLVMPVFNILDDFLQGNALRLQQDIDNFDMTAVQALLTGTTTVVGYATSNDGLNWVVQDPQNFVGNSAAFWDSVSVGSVVNEGTGCSMWYKKGVGDFTIQNLLDLLSGTILPVGYASFTAAPTEAILRITTVPQFRPPAPDPFRVGPVEVWLHAPGAPWTDGTNNGALYYYDTVTNDTSMIDLMVPPGAYDIRVKGITSLKNKIANVVIAAPGPVDVNTGLLLEGDANRDNVVDELDISTLIVNFGAVLGNPGVLPTARNCDFNNDGAVDELDISGLISNFGQYGADLNIR